jgi:peptide/nickel transport system ATP-binding protein
VSKEEARKQAISLLQEVKLLPSDDELQSSLAGGIPTGNRLQVTVEMAHRKQAILNRYPHELSGGKFSG